jgi:hypothetical protein
MQWHVWPLLAFAIWCIVGFVLALIIALSNRPEGRELDCRVLRRCLDVAPCGPLLLMMA